MDHPFRVIAIIAAFNEGDIISPVIGHLVQNGIDVYLLDNHSTDDTVDQARRWLGRGLLTIETFPNELEVGCPGTFNWTAILRRKEELACELRADWFIHHDADEIREGPWPGLTLKESIRWVDKLGYNCVDFRVLNFPPIGDDFRQGDDPRTYFRFCEEGPECDKVQLKCWKTGKSPVSLAPHGGHEARFQGRRIFPMQFLLRHYPIRGQKHGMKKVFAERRNRLLQAEKSQGWHRQYDNIVNEKHLFLRSADELRPFDLDQAREELMLPEKILRSNADRLVTCDREIWNLQSHRLELMKHAGNLEKERNELRTHAGNLERERAVLRKHAVDLQNERDELKNHARNLEKERDELRKHAANLKKEQEELKPHATNLEKERNVLRKHAVDLESERAELKSQAGNLEKERDELRKHTGKLEQVRDQIREELVGLQDTHGALKRYAADLERGKREMRLHVESLESLHQDLGRQKEALEREINALRNSRSWRWTAPLRRLVDRFRAFHLEGYL